jgi:hypothetical protein
MHDRFGRELVELHARQILRWTRTDGEDDPPTCRRVVTVNKHR